MNYVCLNDFMIRSCIDMNEVASTYLVMYEFNVKVCCLMEGFLSMCGVMGFHMCIACVHYDWVHEHGIIMIFMMESKYMCTLVELTILS